MKLIMEYKDIKMVVIASICIGIFILFFQISGVIGIKGETLFFLVSLYAIPMTLFLFIIIPILYLRHINKIKNKFK